LRRADLLLVFPGKVSIVGEGVPLMKPSPSRLQDGFRFLSRPYSQAASLEPNRPVVQHPMFRQQAALWDRVHQVGLQGQDLKGQRSA
jgi:hypothetical protein